MDSTIGIVGLGYVGLPLALTAAEKGWKVIGFDKNVSIVESLVSGISHIDDVSNERLLKSIANGNFVAVSEATSLSDVDICIICVPTPTTQDHNPDLTYVVAASNNIGKILKAECVLVNESTSYPGTLRNVIQREIVKVRDSLGDISGYVAAPERVDPKNSKFDHTNTARVLGGDDPAQVNRVAAFYQSLGPDVSIVSSSEAAEFSKLIENAFRLVNISFVNELAPYASALGVDLIEVINAAATKPFGFMKFLPGPGVGGHCIPVDPHYLINSAASFDVKLPVLNSAIEVNLEVPMQVVKRAQELLPNKTASTVLLIGIAYKDGISDTRETPAIPIAEALLSAGYKVFWLDEAVQSWVVAPKHSNEKIDLAIALTSSTKQQVASVSSSVKVLDCTGRYSNLPNVISYFGS
jgi:UDP-N-acetyl-D-glucosamine dehydrogenase